MLKFFNLINHSHSENVEVQGLQAFMFHADKNYGSYLQM